MALWTLTVKSTRISNGIRLEKGMSVEVVSQNHPIGYNNGEATREAFLCKYGIDLKKASSLHPAYFDIRKN